MLYYHLNSLLILLSEKLFEIRIFPLAGSSAVHPDKLFSIVVIVILGIAERAYDVGYDFGEGDGLTGKAFDVLDDLVHRH